MTSNLAGGDSGNDAPSPSAAGFVGERGAPLAGCWQAHIWMQCEPVEHLIPASRRVIAYQSVVAKSGVGDSDVVNDTLELVGSYRVSEDRAASYANPY